MKQLINSGLFIILMSFQALGADNGQDIVNDPTAHAWVLFSALNEAVPNDPEGRVVWETWKLGREVFADPNQPPVWASESRTEGTFESIPLQQLMRMRRVQGTKFTPPKSQFDQNAGTGNETRMNKAVFDFIISNNLYYAEGIESFAKSGVKFDFPRGGIEIKAQWRRIRPDQSVRYHFAKIKSADGQERLWGLTSLHVTTKELPNWFWATFEHKENPNREEILKDVQPQAQPAVFHGTKWENYVLRGTQLNFTDSIGRPIRLASSQIEGPFQSTSSCITCHAQATVNWLEPGADGINFLAFFDDNQNGSIGIPKADRFLAQDGSGLLRYVQTDFVWSFFRAQRRGH